VTDRGQGRRASGEQLFMALALLKLLKTDGNTAAELLIYDIKAASIAATVREMQGTEAKHIGQEPPVHPKKGDGAACGVWDGFFNDGPNVSEDFER
jgi:hypothetical protein